MFDAVIIAHHAHRWEGAQFFSVPGDPREPVVWVDAQGSLNAWHPVIPDGAVQRGKIVLEWDEVLFRRIATQVREAAVRVVEERMEAIGVPDGYYSQYPLIVRQMHIGDTSFFAPATDETDKEVKQ